MGRCCYCIGSGHPELTDPECCLCLAERGWPEVICERGMTKRWRHFAATLIREFRQHLDPTPAEDPWAAAPF